MPFKRDAFYFILFSFFLNEEHVHERIVQLWALKLNELHEGKMEMPKDWTRMNPLRIVCVFFFFCFRVAMCVSVYTVIMFSDFFLRW